MMRLFTTLLLTAGVLSATESKPMPPAQAESPVLYWSAKGDGTALRLRVLLDGKVMFTSPFSISRLPRSDAQKDYPAKKLTFSFVAGRPIKWLGYRDDEPVSSAK
jgi:hypothetical protein